MQRIQHIIFTLFVMACSATSYAEQAGPQGFEPPESSSRQIGLVSVTQYHLPKSDIALEDSAYYAAHMGVQLAGFDTQGKLTGKQLESLVQGLSHVAECCVSPSSLWRAYVIRERKYALIADFIQDELLVALRNTYVQDMSELSHEDIVTRDLYYLPTRKKVATPLETISKKQRTEINLFAKHWIPQAAKQLARNVGDRNAFSLTQKVLFDELIKVSKSNLDYGDAACTHKQCQDMLGSLQTIEGAVGCEPNYITLSTLKGLLCTRLYTEDGLQEGEKPLATPSTAVDGSCLLDTELKQLAHHLTEDASKRGMKMLRQPSVKTLEFTHANAVEEIKNSFELSALRKDLESKPSSLDVIVFICVQKKWAASYLTVHGQEAALHVIDPHGRNLLNEAGLQELCYTINSGLTYKPMQPKTSSIHKDTKQAAPDSEESDGTPINYDAPLQNISLADLPSLEDFFGDKIPNSIRVRMHQLAGTSVTKRSAGGKLKNCLLLYGPPGTGKSTIAQIMARKAGRNVVYAGGGQFRTAYQGSGNELIQKLFAEAVKRGNCCIIIDEIDGASAQLQSQGAMSGTNEDNRAIKALITTIDQHQHSGIYVICTSNYPEKMDPAIFRRFNGIEIPLPNYEQREKIIRYYFKKNNLEIDDSVYDGVSPGFFDQFISVTDDLSGDAICDIISNAVCEFDAQLEPEKRINLDFRTSGIDWTNKSFLSNLYRCCMIPFQPLKMILCDEANTDMDRHLYSQYMLHMKKRDDLKHLEWLNDPQNKYSKDPLLLRLVKRNRDKAVDILENAIWTAGIRYTADKLSPGSRWLF